MLFGAHESIAGGVHKAIERGKHATCDVVQIFDKSSNQWRAAPLKPEDVEQYFRLQEELGVTVAAAHAGYLINLASPDKELSGKSLLSLKEELTRCNILKTHNLVLHPGSHVGSGEEAGLKRVSENINRLFDSVSDNRCTLALEVTAGQGSNLGHTFEQLACLIDHIDDKAHVGVCLDSCHMFAAGYPLGDRGDYRATMGKFETTVGFGYLRVFHLNDCKQPLGSRRDRHEHIGKGHIGLEGFRNIVNDKRLKDVPMILETPKGEDLREDARNLRVLRNLVKRRRM
jgi:deoxyribonuclease IV